MLVSIILNSSKKAESASVEVIMLDVKTAKILKDTAPRLFHQLLQDGVLVNVKPL